MTDAPIDELDDWDETEETSVPLPERTGKLEGVFGPEAAGERLDKALATAAAELSRSRIKALIETGQLALDGRTIDDASQRVKPGQAWALEVPAPLPATPQPQDIPLDILYEDEWLLVINKPAGMVVHPAVGNADGTLVNALLFHCRDSLSGIGGVARPGIVHRLDKETSGLMVVAKSDAAHQALSAQFADRSLSRTYQAVVWGLPNPRSGRIETQIGRHPSNRQKMAVVARGGKEAITLYRVVRSLGTRATLVECRLKTGRTHQIRVHMTHIGHALVGDPAYGNQSRPLRGLTAEAAAAASAFGRQALHAAEIRFLHPADGQERQFSCPLPLDMNQLIAIFEQGEV
jgi:23S rRNA pseudouridine1911/1915/1917 synthase